MFWAAKRRMSSLAALTVASSARLLGWKRRVGALAVPDWGAADWGAGFGWVVGGLGEEGEEEEDMVRLPPGGVRRESVDP